MGTLVNVAAIIGGSVLGLLLRRVFKKEWMESIIVILGVVIAIISLVGIVTSMITVNDDGTLSSSGSMLLLISLVVGAVLGEWWRLDRLFDRFSTWLGTRFQRQDISKGFITATLLYGIGAMAIIGSIQEGLSGDPSILYLKSGLDAVSSVLLASTLGIGVLFSFVPILIYQGGMTLIASQLSPLITPELLQSITTVGNAIVLVMALGLMKLIKYRAINLVPALLIPLGYAIYLSLF